MICIKKIIPINVDIKDKTPTKTRKHKDFQKYFDLIYKELNDYEKD